MDVTGMSGELRARLRELLVRAELLEDNLRQPLEADSAEQAVDLADDEALAGVDEVLRREIGEVRLALTRINNGTYGTCIKCGAGIDPDRLEALPTASRCISCS